QAASAGDEACRSFSIWKRSRLDHERHAQRRPRKRNCARLRQTRFQQPRDDLKCTPAGYGWSSSGRSRFASVSLKNFAASEFLSRSQRARRQRNCKKKFVLPSGGEFIESSLLSRQPLTLTLCSV